MYGSLYAFGLIHTCMYVPYACISEYVQGRPSMEMLCVCLCVIRCRVSVCCRPCGGDCYIDFANTSPPARPPHYPTFSFRSACTRTGSQPA